jgi:glycosyltransferase involved in cell wall biosynthesis
MERSILATFRPASRASAATAFEGTPASVVPQPHFSVVLPVRNGAGTIGDQLSALAEQEVTEPWELLVVDNGSTDGTREVAERWRDRLPLTIVDGGDLASIAAARNSGVAAARSDRLLFCDSDDVVQPGWIAAHLTALEVADLVGGHLRDDLIEEPADRAGIRWLSPYPTDRLPEASGGPPFAPGANYAVRRQVVEALGGWDAAAHTAEDIDFSWRAHAAGFRLAFAPGALIAYRQRSCARDVARQAFDYGGARRRLQARHRGTIPPRRGPALRVLATGLRLSLSALARPWSRRRRLLWLRWVSYACGWALAGRFDSPLPTVPRGPA